MIVEAIEADAFIDFGNSGVDVANRLRAVAAFITQRGLQLRARLLQVGARGLHSRLVGETDCGKTRE
jgi:hypothetical protein